MRLLVAVLVLALLLLPGCGLLAKVLAVPFRVVNDAMGLLAFWADSPPGEEAGGGPVPLEVALRRAVRQGARGDLRLYPDGAPDAPAFPEPPFPGACLHVIPVTGDGTSEAARALLRAHGLTLRTGGIEKSPRQTPSPGR